MLLLFLHHFLNLCDSLKFPQLSLALDNIDEVVKIIRGADDDADAREKLMTKFGLDEIQQAFLL